MEKVIKKLEVAPAVEKTIIIPTPGRIVNYFVNNQIEDGIISYPAMVVNANKATGAAILQVFLESHVAAFSKVPFSEVPTAGCYSWPTHI